MSSLPSLPSPKTVFGKAFLAELSRGNVERAILFARAFLTLENGPVVRVIDDRVLEILAN